MTDYFFVAMTIAFTVAGQYFQKRMAQQLSRERIEISAITGWQSLVDTRLLAAASCLAIAMLFWLLALKRLDVSVAYPLLAANYIAMLMLARWRFNEQVPPVRWLGVLVIIAGIALIAGAGT